MAYGVLGLSPKEFGEMTAHEFMQKLRGFGWLRLMAARDRAQVIAAIGNFSGNLRKGASLKVERLCPIKNPPDNMFFKMLFRRG